MEYRHLTKHANKEIREWWTTSFENEIGNLAQVFGGHVKGIDTIYFIKYEDTQADQKSKYGQIVVDYHPQKEEPYFTRLTVGGNLINYHHKIRTSTADMLKSELLFNRVLLLPYSKFTGINIKILPHHADDPI